MKTINKKAKNLIKKPFFQWNIEDMETAQSLIKSLVNIVETIEYFEVDDYETIDKIRNNIPCEQNFSCIESEAEIYQGVVDTLRESIEWIKKCK